MTAQEYIIDGLTALSQAFPKITFGYKYNQAEAIHIVHAEPLVEFKNNTDYLIAESDIVYEFENLYLPETLMFISEESLTKIGEPELIFTSNKTGYINKQDEKNFVYLLNCISETIEENDVNYALAA